MVSPYIWETSNRIRTLAEVLAERCSECGGGGRIFASRVVQVCFGHVSSICPVCHGTGKKDTAA